MSKYFIFSLLLLLCFSCEKKAATKVPTQSESSKPVVKQMSVRNLMIKETKTAFPKLNLIRETIAAADPQKEEGERAQHQKISVTMLTAAVEFYPKGDYKNCISRAAQIPLSDPLFPSAQYLMAYSFFKMHAYERAVEIFKGISQNKNFFKEMDRKEAAYMHVIAQHNFYRKTKDNFHKKELNDAIDYYLANYNSNDSTYFLNIKRLKESLGMQTK